MSVWVAHLLKAPGWAVYLGILGTINVFLMVVFWVSIACTHSKYTELLSSEASADRERKREQVRKWRRMLADATRAAIEDKKYIRDVLPRYEDYLSLQPHLSPGILAYLAADHEPEAVTAMIEPVTLEVSKIAKDWGVE